MAFIDSSVVNVALPAIQAELHVPLSQAQWVISAYLLVLGALMLTGGAAGDSLGRRRLFLIGVVSFAVTSVACAFAPNAVTLIAARALQGAAGALLVPNSLTIISAAFPPDERGKAIGTWAGAAGLTTALGPVLGGWLVDTWSWRAPFLINVPVAAVAVMLAVRHVPESRDAQRTRVDWRGGLLAIASLGAITYGLTLAADAGWSSATAIAPVLGGLVLLPLFLWSEKQSSSPMLPLDVFRSRGFTGANAITLLLYFALGGALFLLPYDLIRIQGYSATRAGAAFLPLSLIMGALSRWAGSLLGSRDVRLPLTAGPIVAAVGLVLLAVPGIGGSYWTTFFPALAVLGLGMGISVAPLTTAVMNAVDERHAGAASGINNATARIAGMLAVAILGTVTVSAFRASVDEHLASLNLPAGARQALHDQARKLVDEPLPSVADASTRQAVQDVLKLSFVRSFRIATLIGAACALLSAAFARLIPGPPAPGKKARKDDAYQPRSAAS
jgi:EmrB/QacA subfamily drug resistance transporter